MEKASISGVLAEPLRRFPPTITSNMNRMKSSHLYITMLATVPFAFLGTVQAQSNSPSSSAMPAASTTGISRVAKEEVKSRFTAKDLIGAAVYDTAGDRIGEIADIDLKGALPATLASSFAAGHAADDASRRNTMSGAKSDDAASRPARSTNPAAGAGEMSPSTIYVSVGGLLGIGDDFVSVPASQLSYNATEKRFELSATKADVVALAEQKENTNAYSAGSSPSKTSAAKQAFADEATRVQNALETDPQTSAFAFKVSVTTDGQYIELHGMIDSKEQHDKILATARRATALEVKDKIDLRK
jgi:osmotically-inducible protein OsmY